MIVVGCGSMTSTNAGPEILKQDSRGRVRVPRERREALLAEFERSGLSGVKFAALAGIKYATFAAWVQQRRQQRAGAADEVTDEQGGHWRRGNSEGHM